MLFNEPKLLKCQDAPALGVRDPSFSALQRAEIAEITSTPARRSLMFSVSVLFNEPKLLKFLAETPIPAIDRRFSALQRAEIAEMAAVAVVAVALMMFQCSSTSRNC